MEKLQIGFVTGAGREEVAGLEAMAIDSLWVGGHLSAPNPTPEAMVQLARLSALTERVRIGTSILLLPLYPPAIVAKQIADLDRATGGRVTLGVGVGGEYPSEFEACGVPAWERGPRTDETIPLLRDLWSGEPVSHRDRFLESDEVKIHPPPLQGPALPIVVAGRQPVAMRRAARLGDGWMPYLYSPRRYEEPVATIRETAAADGRDLRDFEWFAFVFVNIDDDPVRAREDGARFLGGTYTKGRLRVDDRPRRRRRHRRRGHGDAAGVRRRRRSSPGLHPDGAGRPPSPPRPPGGRGAPATRRRVCVTLGGTLSP